MECERCERTFVGESSAPIPERLTSGGVLGRRVRGAHDVFLPEARLRQRRRLQRERLRRRIPFARNVACRDPTLLDAEHRLSVRSIEDEQVAALADRRERGNRPASLSDVDQPGRGRLIDVPDVVMHGLEVPAVLPGGDIDGNDGVAEQVAAGAIAAPVVRGGSGHRHVKDAACFVDGHRERPDVRA